MKKTLNEQWTKLCNQYLLEFCNKHDYILEPDPWVCDDVGTIANICDMFIAMEIIRYDIDNDVPEEYFEKWYWKSLDLYELGVTNWMNYPSYCKGAPDVWTEERMQELRESKKRVEQAKADLEKLIDDTKHNKNQNF